MSQRLSFRTYQLVAKLIIKNRTYVLVTGATGFIGAHVVDELLRRGLRVRGATRSFSKGEAMLKARPHTASRLDFVEIDDFGNTLSLDDIVKDIDGVVHVASVCGLPLILILRGILE